MSLYLRDREDKISLELVRKHSARVIDIDTQIHMCTCESVFEISPSPPHQ